jgi:hypothetical protein
MGKLPWRDADRFLGPVVRIDAARLAAVSMALN